jgi:hypothetical protein
MEAPRMSQAQDTILLISSGGDRGRQAFLRLFLTAAIMSDFVTAKRLYEDVLPKMWKEQDRTGNKNWPKEDRDLLLFILQEIIEAM